MRVPGRISPNKAARMLKVHINTVHSWCQKAVSNQPSKLKDVEQHITGYYWISLNEVRALRKKIRRSEKAAQNAAQLENVSTKDQ